MGSWIQRLNTKGTSSAFNSNFLWKNDYIFIMDNHRAAIWCWFQCLKENQNFSIIHIDAHYDSANLLATDLQTNLKIKSYSYCDFLEIKSSRRSPLFSWDNYNYYLVHFYEKNISKFFTATHKINYDNSISRIMEDIEESDLPNKLSEITKEQNSHKWILNLDLDYFFEQNTPSKPLKTLMNSQYRQSIFKSINKLIQSNKVICLTVCLSPECCGGWDKSESICQELCMALGLEFTLDMP